VLADRLGFQFLPLAPGVLALAGYFQEACRIGTRITTVLFPVRRYTVAGRMCAFSRRIHESSFCRGCPISPQETVAWRSGVIALSEYPYSARQHIVLCPLRSIASVETTIWSVLLIMGRYWEVKLNGQPRCGRACTEEDRTVVQQKRAQRRRSFFAS